MNRILKIFTMSFLVCMGSAQIAASAPVILPPPVPPFAIQYDEFFSYSAKILTALGFAGYDVPTGTGGLDVLVYTGATGQNNLNTGIPPVYDFPKPLDAPGGGITSFAGVWGPNEIPPGPVFVDTLLQYLHTTFGPTVNTPVFDFDMNQTGQNPDLQVVGDVIIRKPDNSVLTNFSFDAINNGVFDPTAWVTAPGTITIPDPNNPGQFITVDNNKGSGKLDFVLVSPGLNLTNFAGAGNTIEFDFRLQGLNDGFEELFLTGAFQPNAIPEPGTMLLMGLGALGASALRRRSKKA